MVNDGLSSPNDKNDRIYAYTVIGRRTYNVGSDVVPVDSLKQARPMAAVYPDNSNPPGINLTEEYRIPNGIRVMSVKSTDSSGVSSNSHLAGIYTNIVGDAGVGSSDSLQAVLYPVTNNIDTQDWTSAWSIMHCINATVGCAALDTPPPSNPPAKLMKTWEICLGSTRNNDRGKLTFSSNNGSGVITSLETGVNICS